MESDDNRSGRGTEAGSLDLASRDVRTVGMAIERWPDRWRGMTDKVKDKICAGMDAAMNLADELLLKENMAERVAGAELAIAVAGTAVKMVTHQQKDDHHAIDAARGAGEHRTENKIIVIPSPVVKDMAEMRKLAEKREPTP